MITEQNIQQFSKQCERIFTQIRRDVIGQQEVVEGTVIAMIAGGNVLLEGVPGVGKTRLVRTLGRVFDLPFSRIQFTPDLMPADVTGTNIIVKDDSGNSTFSFQPGPIFSNIILADEINRATPKTQSALLEAMQEHTVTVMGVSRKMPEPFFVLATQNPVEQDGTYPLPEAQMDRFMFKLVVPNPSLEELMTIVDMTQQTMEEVAEPACTGEELLAMRATANQIPVAQDVMRYAMTLCSATHPDSECASEAAKIRPPGRQPPCGSVADFRGEGQGADEGALQCFFLRPERARLSRSAPSHEDELRGDRRTRFSRRSGIYDHFGGRKEFWAGQGHGAPTRTGKEKAFR